VAVASGLTLVLDILVLGGRLPGLALLNVVAVLVFGCVLTLLLRSSSRLVGRFSSPERHRLLRAVWAIAVVVLLLWLSTRTTVQIPRCPSPEPSPVGSLRSSAGDLARFLIEVTRPRHVSPQIAREIRTAQVRIDDDFSWGLGLGIQHSSRGDALWQMGITLGFRSVVVIYPEHGWGVVVLTNSDDGLPVAYDVAGRALGGKANWSQF
jgi:CubicO group peptidase (beta-lactamase class C family)